MSDSQRPTNPADRLIAADPGISEPRLEEFRMRLENSLESLEQTAWASRRNMMRAIVAVAICLAARFVLSSVQNLGTPINPAVGIAWVLASWAAQISAIVIIARYWHTHRPALERGRTDLQIAMFGELQRQITELNRRLDKPA